MTEKKTKPLHEIIERNESDKNNVTKFFYAKFNGNIKVRLTDNRKVRFVLILEKMQGFEISVSEILNTE